MAREVVGGRELEIWLLDLGHFRMLKAFDDLALFTGGFSLDVSYFFLCLSLRRQNEHGLSLHKLCTGLRWRMSTLLHLSPVCIGAVTSLDIS